LAFGDLLGGGEGSDGIVGVYREESHKFLSVLKSRAGERGLTG
jgi:hypothetical protein